MWKTSRCDVEEAPARLRVFPVAHIKRAAVQLHFSFDCSALGFEPHLHMKANLVHKASTADRSRCLFAPGNIGPGFYFYSTLPCCEEHYT